MTTLKKECLTVIIITNKCLMNKAYKEVKQTFMKSLRKKMKNSNVWSVGIILYHFS